MKKRWILLSLLLAALLCLSGCGSPASSDWEFDPDYHWQVNDEGEIVKKDEHSAGTTFSTPCSKCGVCIQKIARSGTVRTIDEHGNSLLYNTYVADSDGVYALKDVLIYENQYDEDGNRIFSTCHKNGALYNEEHRSYDEEAGYWYSDRDIYYREDGTVVEYRSRAFAQRDRDIIYETDGSIRSETIYTYEFGSQGLPVYVAGHTNGVLSMEKIYKIDQWDMPHLEREWKTNEDGTVLETIYVAPNRIKETLYDQNGNVIEK